MYKYETTADIRILTGPLAGVTIADGFRVPEVDEAHALKTAQWIDANPTVSSSTNQYEFTSKARITRL